MSLASKFTEHSIKNSPYKNGDGDLVYEFIQSCKKYGIKAGLYLSPWDRNHKDYGTSAYIEYYKDQLTELLTEYGEINEIWFDGANGGDGYYGGANEIRKIDPKTYYPWNEIHELARNLQPNIKIFSDAGPDVRWIGNEMGFAGETFWSCIDIDKIIVGQADLNYLNNGDPMGKNWVVGQCDVSIRPGWFYHQSHDSIIKTPEELLDIYYKSVGRNAVLLLNLPPTKAGIIHQHDVNSLIKFKQLIERTFSDNLIRNAKVSASNIRGESKLYAPKNILDEDIETYWACDDSVKKASLTIDFGKKVKFDRILLQEPIQLGQRISKFSIEIFNENEWKEISSGTTIGYKRLIRINTVSTNKMRLQILNSYHAIALSNIGIYLSSEKN